MREYINQIIKFLQVHPLYAWMLLIVFSAIGIFIIIRIIRIRKLRAHKQINTNFEVSAPENKNHVADTNQGIEIDSDSKRTIENKEKDVVITKEPEKPLLENEKVTEKNKDEENYNDSNLQDEIVREITNEAIVNEPESKYDNVERKSDEKTVNEDEIEKENKNSSQDFSGIETNDKRRKSTSSKKTSLQKSSGRIKERKIISHNDVVEEKQILSEPNKEQTNDLKIGYLPNNFFEQEEPYKYPVVKMPLKPSLVKLPRVGRSDKRGYKEKDFSLLLQKQISDLEINTNWHMAIPSCSIPYEPDIVLYDKNINLYIDIEIDEPYDGYYRFPTHELENKDNVRDLFFNESGWIVIRFTEKQIHEQPNECIQHIKNVLSSIQNNTNYNTAKITSEPQWDIQQAIRWEKQFYREKYLGIQSFGKHISKKRIVVKEDDSTTETIERLINRTKIYNSSSVLRDISFDESNHAYFPATNNTGNADFISVTTLIDKFFPFDLERYINRKSAEENKPKDIVQAEWERKRDEAAEKGIYLHKQIENFLIGQPCHEDFTEFEQFNQFYTQKVVSQKLKFVEAEKIITLKDYNIAGTIDALFKKPNGDYVIIDWKRSKNLLIDGYPKKYGYGMGLSELSHLDNSSYYKYELQQSFYKYILEKEYNMKVSSMILAILHEKYTGFGFIKLKKYRKREIEIILNALNHKI